MKRNEWTVCIGALFLVLAVVASACAPAAVPTPTPTAPKPAAATPTAATPVPATPTPPPATKPATLRFGSTGALSYAGAYIAADKGFFKEQGIDMEFEEFRQIPDMVAPLSTGQLDVLGMPLSTALLAAADRGIQLKVVADGGQERAGSATFWLVLRKDLADSGQVKTPADLKGKKIAIPSPGSAGEILARKTLEQGGLRPEDAELVVLPHAEQATAFANKAIDAGTTPEPFIARGVQEGYSVKWIPYYKYFGDKAQVTVVVFGANLLKDKDLAQRWMAAYLKGVRLYQDAFERKVGRDEVIKIMAKYTPVKEPKLYDLMEMPYLDPNGALEKKSMQAQYQWLVDNGFYKGKTSFDDITDLSFAEYAAQKLSGR